VTDLPPAAAAALRAAAQVRSAEITALAQSLIATDGAGDLVGRMLMFALTVPGPMFLYSVGEKPVQILWGHQAEADLSLETEPLVSPPEVPIPPSAGLRRPALPPQSAAERGASASGPEAAATARDPNRQTPPAATPVSDSGSQTDAAAAEPAAFAVEADGGHRPPRRGFWGWLFWLLPLLLLVLILFLAVKACTPLAPRVVEVPDPTPPAQPIDPTADLAARLKALQAERDRLAAERQAIVGQCVPDDPTPPKRVEDLPAGPKPLAPTPAEPSPTPPSPPAPGSIVPEAPPVRPPAPPVQTPPASTPPAPTPASPSAPPAIPTPQSPKAEAPPSCKPNFTPGDEPEVVLIVDGSGSMNEAFGGSDSRIAQARRSIATVVEGLPAGVDVGLIDFRGCDNVRRDKFYPDRERGQLIGEINGLTPWGGTPLARSIDRAGNIVSSDVDSVIVIVSDGEESCGGDPCAAARAVKAAKPKAVINVIDISGDAKGRAVVQCVASVTGGQVLKPNSPLDLKNKIQQATRQPDMRACRK
jgi:hypothetical protein